MMQETGAEVPARRQPPQTSSTVGQTNKDDVTVLLQGQRIKITATVDLEGIGRLKDMLAKYEEILKMLQ